MSESPIPQWIFDYLDDNSHHNPCQKVIYAHHSTEKLMTQVELGIENGDIPLLSLILQHSTGVLSEKSFKLGKNYHFGIRQKTGETVLHPLLTLLLRRKEDPIFIDQFCENALPLLFPGNSPHAITLEEINDLLFFLIQEKGCALFHQQVLFKSTEIIQHTSPSYLATFFSRLVWHWDDYLSEHAPHHQNAQQDLNELRQKAHDFLKWSASIDLSSNLSTLDRIASLVSAFSPHSLFSTDLIAFSHKRLPGGCLNFEAEDLNQIEMNTPLHFLRSALFKRLNYHALSLSLIDFALLRESPEAAHTLHQLGCSWDSNTLRELCQRILNEKPINMEPKNYNVCHKILSAIEAFSLTLSTPELIGNSTHMLRSKRI